MSPEAARAQVDGPENVVVLDGQLLEPAQLRRSPAGVPIARFMLAHDSVRVEHATGRRVTLRVGVRAVGETLAAAVQAVPPGTALRVTGHLARPRLREGDSTLIIVASRIERLGDNGTTEE